MTTEADQDMLQKFIKESCPFTNFNRERLFNCFLHSYIVFVACLDPPLDKQPCLGGSILLIGIPITNSLAGDRFSC